MSIVSKPIEIVFFVTSRLKLKNQPQKMLKYQPSSTGGTCSPLQPNQCSLNTFFNSRETKTTQENLPGKKQGKKQKKREDNDKNNDHHFVARQRPNAVITFITFIIRAPLLKTMEGQKIITAIVATNIDASQPPVVVVK